MKETVIGTAFEAGWMKAFGKSADVPLSERFYGGRAECAAELRLSTDRSA